MNNINRLVKLVKQELKKVENKRINNFNIFSILKMERKEVETHSAFIYELINPYGSHNQKDLYLTLFIENVLNINDYGKIIKVSREDPTIENRRIDFVIETKKELIGIEMKIDAGDQYEQLHSYKEELELRKKFNQNINLFYLTLFGSYASKESTKRLLVNKDYKTISFYNNIDIWLDICIKHTIDKFLKEAIKQYKNLINIITEKENKQMSNFIENMNKDINDIKAMDIISNNYPLIWAKKEIEFWQTIEKNLSNQINNSYIITYLTDFFEDDELSHFRLNDVRTTANKIREPFGIYLKKNIKDTNYYIEISVLYGYCNQKEIFIEFNIYNQNSHNEKSNKKIRDIQDKIYTVISTKVNFYHSVKNNNLTFQLFEDEYFTNITKELTDEIIDYINLIDNQMNNIVNAIC
jgi:hypothetical protein